MAFHLRSNTHWKFNQITQNQIAFSWVNCIFENKKWIFLFLFSKKKARTNRKARECNRDRIQLKEADSRIVQLSPTPRFSPSPNLPSRSLCLWPVWVQRRRFSCSFGHNSFIFTFYHLFISKSRANKNATFSISRKPDREFTFYYFHYYYFWKK